MTEEQTHQEEYKVSGHELKEKIKQLIHEGNIRRIIIKNDKGITVFEIPVTVGAIVTIAAPVLAAVSAIAALMTNCTIVVVKKGE